MSFGLALVADVLVQFLKCFPYIFSSRHHVNLASRFSFSFSSLHSLQSLLPGAILVTVHSFIHSFVWFHSKSTWRAIPSGFLISAFTTSDSSTNEPFSPIQSKPLIQALRLNKSNLHTYPAPPPPPQKCRPTSTRTSTTPSRWTTISNPRTTSKKRRRPGSASPSEAPPLPLPLTLLPYLLCGDYLKDGGQTTIAATTTAATLVSTAAENMEEAFGTAGYGSSTPFC